MNGRLNIPTLKKRCQRCDQLYEIPNIRRSNARDLIIQFHPCSHCLFIQDQPDSEKSGRCRSCSVPFTIIDHHALGKCKRDYERDRRAPRK